jgi:RimJ/RimL family protein N-acetyltransferase
MLFLNAPRMALLALDADLAQLQASSRTAFFNAIAVTHCPVWPPEPFGDVAVAWSLDNLQADPGAEGWYGWLLLANEGEHKPPSIIGGAALVGRPDLDGDVELVIGVRPEFASRGHEREAALALSRWALANGAKRVLVHFDAEEESAAEMFAASGFEDTREPPYPGVARWALTA